MSGMSGSDSESGPDLFGEVGGMFEEPDDFRPPTPPTTTTVYERLPLDWLQGPPTVSVRLVSKHSLWGHLVWNSATTLVDAMDIASSDESATASTDLGAGPGVEPVPHLPLDVRGKTVVELGAGGGLPSLVAALNGASAVVVTDYAEDSLIENIAINIDALGSALPQPHKIVALGHTWGTDPEPLLTAFPECSEGFDIVFLADLIFNRQSHQALLKSIWDLLSSTGTAWMTYSHHDPELTDKDMNFFKLAVSEPYCFVVEDVCTRQMVDLFKEDDGMDQDRGVVYFKTLRKPQPAE